MFAPTCCSAVTVDVPMPDSDPKNHTFPRGQAQSLTQMAVIGGGWLLAGRFSRTLVTLVGVAILARLLIPADFGVLAMATSIILLTQAMLVGLIDQPILRHDELTQNGLRSLIWMSTALMFAVIVGIWIAAPWIEQAINFPRLGLALRTLIPISLAQVFMLAGLALLRRQHRFSAVAMINFTTVLIYVVTAVGLAVQGYGLASLLAAQLVSWFATALIAILAAGLPLLPPRPFDLSSIGRTSGFGIVTEVLAWAWTNVDTIAVGWELGPGPTGIYSRAYNISARFKEPFAALDLTVREAVAALKNRASDVRDKLLVILRLMTIGSATAAAAVIVLRVDIVNLLLGDQWNGAVPVLAILIVALPARIALMFFNSVATAAGDMRWMVNRNVFLLITISIGLWWTVPMGLTAVATTVTSAVYLSLLLPQGRLAKVPVPSTYQMICTMLPGLLFALILALAGSILFELVASYGVVIRIIIIGTLFVVSILLFLVLMPTSWLPRNVTNFQRK